MFRLLRALLLAAPALAVGQTAVVQTAEVRAELIAHAPQGLGPGKPAWLGLALRHSPHWHSYWKNPGDSGMATVLRWTLPEGASAGAIEWPTPKRLPVGPLVNYGYEGDVLLPVALKPGSSPDAVGLHVKLNADWLVCKDVCIPQAGEFALTLPANAPLVAHASAFAAAREALPRALPGVAVQARVDADALALELHGLPAHWHGLKLDYLAEDAGVIEHAAAAKQRWSGDTLSLRVPLSAQRSENPSSLRAVLTASGEPAGISLEFKLDGGWPPIGVAPPALQGTAAASQAEPRGAAQRDATGWVAVVVVVLAVLALGLGIVRILRR